MRKIQCIKEPEKLINQKFNYLTVTGFIYREDKRKVAGYRAICICDCGKEIEEFPRKIINGQRKTCGIKGCPYFHQVRVDSSKKSSIGSFTGHEGIYGSRWAAWRIGAEKRGLEFKITKEYAWNLFIEQDKKCALSGTELCFDGKWNSTKTTASLDRIDSSKGYVEGNIQWVHKKINLMKGNMTDEEFTTICKSVFLWRETLNKR